MDSDTAPLIIVIVILIALSAFFSSCETAYSSLNKVKLKAMEASGVKGKRIEKALRLAENYDTLLSTILVGNNLVNIASSSIATLVFTGILGNNKGTTVSTIVMTVLVLIFGEVSPKQIAKEKAESYAILVAPILKFFVIIFTPINILFKGWKKLLNKIFRLGTVSTVTEEELKTYVDEAHTGGEIDENESRLIRSSIEFDDIAVSDILTPRVDVEAVSKTLRLTRLKKYLRTAVTADCPYISAILTILWALFTTEILKRQEKRGSNPCARCSNPCRPFLPTRKSQNLCVFFRKTKPTLPLLLTNSAALRA